MLSLTNRPSGILISSLRVQSPVGQQCQKHDSSSLFFSDISMGFSQGKKGPSWRRPTFWQRAWWGREQGGAARPGAAPLAQTGRHPCQCLGASWPLPRPCWVTQRGWGCGLCPRKESSPGSCLQKSFRCLCKLSRPNSHSESKSLSLLGLLGEHGCLPHLCCAGPQTADNLCQRNVWRHKAFMSLTVSKAAYFTIDS